MHQRSQLHHPPYGIENMKTLHLILRHVPTADALCFAATCKVYLSPILQDLCTRLALNATPQHLYPGCTPNMYLRSDILDALGRVCWSHAARRPACHGLRQLAGLLFHAE